VGLAIDIFTKDMGAAVNALPGGDIVPAMDRGLLDAAEFNNATSDRLLGFPDVAKVCMLQSFHQCAENFEILFNKKKYDALPKEVKSIIEHAVEAASAEMSWKAIDRYSKDYIEMQQKQGVKFYKTPDSVLRAQLEGLGRGHCGQVGREPDVQEGARFATRVRAARGALAERHQRRLQDGLQPFLRQETRRQGARQEGLIAASGFLSRPIAGRPLFIFFRGVIGKSKKLLLTMDKASVRSSVTPVPGRSWRSPSLITWEVFSRYVLTTFPMPGCWTFRS
jgi:hypothetical protein